MQKAKSITISLTSNVAEAMEHYAEQLHISTSEAWRDLVYTGACGKIESATKLAREVQEQIAKAQAKGEEILYEEMMSDLVPARAVAKAAMGVARKFAASYQYVPDAAYPSAATILQTHEVD